MVKNVVAIAVLVVLGVAALLVFRDRPAEEKKEAVLAIAPVPADKLDTIRIKRWDGPDESATLESLTLKKKDGVWRMVEPVDYPITEGSVTRMVDALKDLKAIDVISENKENHANFEVDDRHGIDVTALEGEKELAHLIVGKSKGGMTFVRPSGKDQVYRVQGYHRTAFNKSVQSLREKTITNLEMQDVKKVTFVNPQGELTLERSGEGAEATIAPVGEEIKNFDEMKAKSLVRSAIKLNAREFVDDELPPGKTGLTEDAPKFVIEPETEGEAVTVWLGNLLEEKSQIYVKASSSNQIFLISKTMGEKLGTAKKDEFARTDEEVAKAEERKKKAAEAAARGAPAMGGTPGTQQIPPDVMRKIQAQMAAQKQAPQ